MYQIKTEAFSGPMEKLLELIEEKKMDINQISLAEVTADFLKHVEFLKTQIGEGKDASDGDIIYEKKSLRVLADFLVVAAQLILIKSRSILPNLPLSEDEEKGIYDLELRLKIYSQIKPMVTGLKSFWSTTNQSYSRPMFYGVQPFFYPPTNVELKSLENLLSGILRTLGSLVLDEEKIERQVITLEQKIKEISERISTGGAKFSQMAGNKNRGEVIVLFLALLHLLRDHLLVAKQENDFGDINVEKM